MYQSENASKSTKIKIPTYIVLDSIIFFLSLSFYVVILLIEEFVMKRKLTDKQQKDR